MKDKMQTAVMCLNGNAKTLFDGEIYYKRRCDVEHDQNFRQVIPYVVIYDTDNKILTYARKGTEQRLHGYKCLGVGGHVDLCQSAIAGTKHNYQYIDRLPIVRHSAKREIVEEIGLYLYDYQLVWTGEYIRLDTPEVSMMHIGMIFFANISDTEKENIKLSEEFDAIEFKRIEDIQCDIMSYEQWSINVLDYCKKAFDNTF